MEVGGRPGREFRALVSRLGEQFSKEWLKTEQRLDAGVTVLNVCRMLRRVERKPHGIHRNIGLFDFDLLTGNLSVGVDIGPLGPLNTARSTFITVW
jgi:hypothetical protein